MPSTMLPDPSGSDRRTSGPPREVPDFRVAGKLVQPRLNRIVAGDDTQRVEPKLMDVLVLLASRPGEVFTKNEILETVWGDVHVTEDVLVRAVSELRRIFADDPESPRVIETIRKKGYRLLASATLSGAAGSAAMSPGAAPRATISLLAAGGAVLILAAVAAAIAFPRLLARPRPSETPRFQPFATSPGNEVDPAVSPDGTRIAFAWNGGEGRSDALWMRRVDGSTPERLTHSDGSDRAPVFSPDGSRLAFTRRTPDACDLVVLPTAGGPERRVAPCPDAEHPRMSWSGDGRWLAVSVREAADKPFRIRLFEVDGEGRRDLTAPPEGIHGDEDPVFSPDGKTLAFARFQSPSAGDIFTIPAAGGAAERVTNDNADLIGLAWVDGGTGLVFSSDRGGVYGLWRVPSDGGAITFVAGGGSRMKHPAASRAGDLVAYENWNYEINIWRVALGQGGIASAAPRPFASVAEHWSFHPQFSPDGKTVAFASTRSGHYEIWLADADGGSATRLTSFGGPWVGHPRFSPDGARLVVEARPEGLRVIYLVDRSGGGARRLTTGAGGESAPSFSRDGKSVYFASRRSGTWEVWKADVETGGLVQVTTRGGYSASETGGVGGPWLVFTRLTRRGLFRMPSGGGEESLIDERFVPEDWPNLAVRGDTLYTVERPAPDFEARLARRIGSRPAEPLASLPDLGWPGIAVSPDGSTALYARTDRRDANIFLMRR